MIERMIDERLKRFELSAEAYDEIRKDAISILQRKLEDISAEKDMDAEIAGDAAVMEALQRYRDTGLLIDSISGYIEDLRDGSDLPSSFSDNEIMMLSRNRRMKKDIACRIMSCGPSAPLLALMKGYQMADSDETERKSAAYALSLYIRRFLDEDIYPSGAQGRTMR